MPLALSRRAAGALLLAGAGAALLRVPAAGAASQANALEQAFVDAETRLNARLGAFVLDTGSGRTWAHRAGERFAFCSTFKAPLAGAVLARVDRGEEDLERRVPIRASDLVTYSPVTELHVGERGLSVGELCEAAATRSDNTAANLLIASHGGPEGVTRFLRGAGDETTRLDRTETTLNEAMPRDPRDTTTPEAFAGTLRALVLGDVLRPASRERLAGWMRANTTGADKLRAGLPETWTVGDRTGAGGQGTANVVAVIWPPNRAPVVATLFVTETEAALAQKNEAMAEIARRIVAALKG